MPVSQARLWEAIHYDPSTGVFLARIERGRTHAGDRLGTVAAATGHLVFHVDAHLATAGRWAFLYMRGYMPVAVEHIDEDRANLKWQNLRQCTYSQNALHRTALQANNKTGYRGVCYDATRGKYVAQLAFERRKLLRRRFDTAEDAARAYDRAVIQHGLADRLQTNEAAGRLAAA